MSKHIEVTDITGKVWKSGSDDQLDGSEATDSLHELLRNFNDLNHLRLEVDGLPVWFNPAHILAVAIKADS